MLSQVVADGRVIRFAQDPPGQQTSYIYSGDVEIESNRLATFSYFPSSTSVNFRQLANNGFFYTGYRDRIKCFCCGNAVEDMRAPVDKRQIQSWHDPNCQFSGAADTGKRLIDTTSPPVVTLQPKTSGSKPSTSPLHRKLTAGELLLCGSVSRGSPVPTPTVPLSVVQSTRAVEKYTSNAPVPAHPRISPSHAHTHRNQEVANAQAFPCRSPTNPHMAEERRRFATFDRKWPHHINATPQQLANAGFYFLGERDRLKCWYCNKGFHNWERNDDPWKEHAKHSPNCEFLLRCKGPEFVRCVNNGKGQDVCGTNWAEACQREEKRKLAATIQKEMEKSEIVATVKELGFEDATILKALMRCRETNAVVTSATLIDECLKETAANAESDEISQEHENNGTSPKSSSDDCLKELQKMNYDRQCKVCLLEKASVVLLPCHHLASCDGCRESSQKCPICKINVENMVPRPVTER